MSPKPIRLIAAGGLLLALSVAFALFMMSVAPRSNDPAALMRLVGGLCGGLGGVSAMIIAVGLVRRRAVRT